MRFLEKLPLVVSPEYRVAFDEEDLSILASLFLAYKDPSDAICLAALELSEILKQVKGDDFRHYQKLSQKLKKMSSRPAR